MKSLEHGRQWLVTNRILYPFFEINAKLKRVRTAKNMNYCFAGKYRKQCGPCPLPCQPCTFRDACQGIYVPLQPKPVIILIVIPNAHSPWLFTAVARPKRHNDGMMHGVTRPLRKSEQSISYPLTPLARILLQTIPDAGN